MFTYAQSACRKYPLVSRRKTGCLGRRSYGPTPRQRKQKTTTTILTALPRTMMTRPEKRRALNAARKAAKQCDRRDCNHGHHYGTGRGLNYDAMARGMRLAKAIVTR